MHILTLDERDVRPGNIRQADGTATIITGTNTFFASIATMKELARSPADLQNFIAALEEREAEEDMVSAWPEDTGVDNAIKILPRMGASHGPRIKVALDPPDRPTGSLATVPFDSATVPEIPSRLERQVRAFIDLNREALVAFYDGEISGIALARRLRKIDTP
jgi:hypothetical protein